MNEDIVAAEIDRLVPQQATGRRGFIVTSLGAGFALAVLPVAAQTITTSTEGIESGEVKIPTADGSIPGYRAMPATGTNFPVILVVQEIFGVHEHIRDVVRRFAKQGYFAIAPELYARQGDVSKMTDIPAIISNVVAKVTDVQVMGDLDAAVAFAKASGKADVSRLGITGFCWGGRITWMYASHNPALKAGVAWYGPLVRGYAQGDKGVLDVVDKIKAPMLGLYGGADGGIPNDSVEKMRAALKAAGNMRSEIIIYPDAPHAFHADYRPSYRKEQAEDGWKRALAWFKQNLG